MITLASLYDRAMRVTASTQIDCPPEKVFDILADVRNDTEWNSRVSSAELQSPEPIGLGSRFSMVNNGGRYDVTITTYDRPSHLVLEARGRPDLTIAYTLTPADGGTDLDSDFDFQAKGSQKVVFALVAPLVRREVPKQFASLKAFCESSSGGELEERPG
jgi:uncharacterized protein YndB with AHSA1/START domain